MGEWTSGRVGWLWEWEGPVLPDRTELLEEGYISLKLVVAYI